MKSGSKQATRNQILEQFTLPKTAENYYKLQKGLYLHSQQKELKLKKPYVPYNFDTTDDCDVIIHGESIDKTRKQYGEVSMKDYIAKSSHIMSFEGLKGR